MKKGQPQTKLSPCAGEGTRTHTLAHQILSLACLPISTHPQGLPVGNLDDERDSAESLGNWKLPSL